MEYDDLNPEQLAVLEIIEKTVGDGCIHAIEHPGTQKYGVCSVFLIRHEPGIGKYFSYDEQKYSFIHDMEIALGNIGYYAEQCTLEYSAIYKV